MELNTHHVPVLEAIYFCIILCISEGGVICAGGHPEFWYQNSLLFKSLGSVQFYFYFKNDSKYIYSIIINAVLIHKIILRGGGGGNVSQYPQTY